jgi:hypothetical protein
VSRSYSLSIDLESETVDELEMLVLLRLMAQLARTHGEAAVTGAHMHVWDEPDDAEVAVPGPTSSVELPSP